MQDSLQLSISNYFGYLQSHLEELAQYEPLSDIPEEAATIIVESLDRLHTYQFLMSLKSEFKSLCTHILNTSPLPSLYEAFAIPDGDERCQRLIPTSLAPISDSLLPLVSSIAPVIGNLWFAHTVTLLVIRRIGVSNSILN